MRINNYNFATLEWVVEFTIKAMYNKGNKIIEI